MKFRLVALLIFLSFLVDLHDGKLGNSGTAQPHNWETLSEYFKPGHVHLGRLNDTAKRKLLPEEPPHIELTYLGDLPNSGDFEPVAFNYWKIHNGTGGLPLFNSNPQPGEEKCHPKQRIRRSLNTLTDS